MVKRLLVAVLALVAMTMQAKVEVSETVELMVFFPEQLIFRGTT